MQNEPQTRQSASGIARSSGRPSVSQRPSASGISAPWEDGGPSGRRGFVKVKSVRAPPGLEWSHSRRCLETLINQERERSVSAAGAARAAEAGAAAAAASAEAAAASSPSPGPLAFQSHEARLRQRLEALSLDMLIVAGDGNCQFRSVSNELYGTQEHHGAIRRAAVAHIAARRPAYECFLGEEFEGYLRSMGRSCTWGDELTLRAVCDSFGITVHVVTSDVDNWYLTYEPEERKVDREIFLTYIAPVHYNSIRRRSSLKTMALTVSRSFRKLSSSSSLSRTFSGARSGAEEEEQQRINSKLFSS